MRIGSICGSIRAIYSGNIATIPRCRSLSATHLPTAISGITIKIAQRQSARENRDAKKHPLSRHLLVTDFTHYRTRLHEITSNRLFLMRNIQPTRAHPQYVLRYRH
ncbi:hypothetical protein [Burkholderia sp. IDO3]|uniref:hypothetical protein n=1 Tax=Burkholderia sp. IDO3 TaxID=1705310 RepID=UPI0013B4008B|nr:hypothetical protein [Burkholderia sp. IDO3]